MAGRISAAVGQLSTGIIPGVELSGGNSHAPRRSSPSPPPPLMTQPVVGRWDGKKSPHIAFANVNPAPLGGDARGGNPSPRGAHPFAPDRKKENMRVKAGGLVPRDGSPYNSGAFQKAAPVSWTPAAQPSPPHLNDTFSFPALGSPSGSVGSSIGSSSTYSTPGSSPAGSPLLGARWGGPKERKRYESAGLARASKAPESKSPTGGETKGLRRGLLVEFEKENNRRTLAAVQKPDGKKNWMTQDQFGNLSSIRPQQLTYVVPSKEEYTAADIIAFLDEVECIQDVSLLELAWEEAVDGGVASVSAEDLAATIYMSAGGVECYACHRLLSNDKVFFKRKGPGARFEPRPAPQVEELKARVAADEVQRLLMWRFVDAVKRAVGKPMAQKPGPDSWQKDEVCWPRLEAIKEYALELPGGNKPLAEQSLELLSIHKSPSAALDLLARCGLLPPHLNTDLLKSDVRQAFPPPVLQALEELITNPPPDPDESRRLDLRGHKVYTIDSSDTVEVDDGLSVETLPDGRRRVWIHVADPTRWLQPHDLLDMEARERGTSIYLCTGVLPMFPLTLAAGAMSLRQGECCCAMSVGIILWPDGSIAETQVSPSWIVPTYRLSYEDVTDVLAMAGQEEKELGMLAEIAAQRLEWRKGQGAIEMSMPEMDIKVGPTTVPEPQISIHVMDQSTLPRRLVSELMVLCGEAIAAFGGDSSRSLPLPYRGQPEPDLPDPQAMQSIPEGYCTAVHLRRFMTRGETNCTAPITHASLGLGGYVQFTSPIRRYGDLIAHFQVKAVLRGEVPPFASSEIEGMMGQVGVCIREARRQEGLAARYWVVEYLRRQPRGKVWEGIVLRWIKDGETLGSVFLKELGYEAVMRLTRSVKLGATIGCVVTDADPRRDVLRLQEALYFQANSKAKETAKAQADAANVARAETGSKLPSSEVVGVEVRVG